MTPADRRQFAAILTGFAELKGRHLSSAALDLFWHAMQDWSIEDFTRAANRLIRSCEYLPTPKDFEDLRNAGRQTTGEAWAQVLQHLKGGYRTGGLSPELDRAVAALGGYRALAMMPSDQLHWQEKRFAEHFEDLRDAEDTRKAIPQIAAVASARGLPWLN